MSVASDLTSLELVNPGTQAYAYARVTVRDNIGASRNAGGGEFVEHQAGVGEDDHDVGSAAAGSRGVAQRPVGWSQHAVSTMP
jgi:hypothetical protein